MAVTITFKEEFVVLQEYTIRGLDSDRNTSLVEERLLDPKTIVEIMLKKK